MDSSDVTAGTDATALSYNNLRKDVILAKGVPGTETDAATVTIDWSDKTKGKIRTVTIAGSRTIAFSNVTVGQFLILRVIQGGTGSYTLTWPANISWPYGVVPTLSTAVGKIDWLVFYCKVAGATPTYDGFQSGTIM